MANTEEVDRLILNARQGDPQCRDELFEKCRTYLGIAARAQVESWLQAKVDASDIVQQTMLEAFRDFDRFDGTTQREWLGWLKRIMTNNATDYVRRYAKTAKRQIGRELRIRTDDNSTERAFGVAEPAAHDRSPSQQMMLSDDELRVSEAMMQLSDDHREVIMLRNLQRLSFNEVAERMERTRPAVQMLWMRAIKRLQELLGPEEEDV